ncbi:MAG: Gfo/Idh/MocA family oxidoreductase, partial [Planctomycetes bacterium]|nr:Gfo/Idh/MocA family oxidoreductase [Planctomycetota bacterium]
MAKTVNVVMIGLDTSHSIAFAQRIQGKAMRGVNITRCLRFPSPFQTEAQQDDRQKILEDLGIEVTSNFKQAVAGAEGVLLEINDPAQHWKYFKKAAELNVPIFVDKPLAKNLSDAKKICELTKRKRLKVWEASSLRFSPDLRSAIKQAGEPELVNIYGAMGIAAAGCS